MHLFFVFFFQFQIHFVTSQRVCWAKPNSDKWSNKRPLTLERKVNRSAIKRKIWYLSVYILLEEDRAQWVFPTWFNHSKWVFTQADVQRLSDFLLLPPPFTTLVPLTCTSAETSGPRPSTPPPPPPPSSTFLPATSQLYNKPQNKREFHSCAICSCLIFPILCIINVHFFQRWIFFSFPLFTQNIGGGRGGYIGQRPRCLISNSPLPGY